MKLHIFHVLLVVVVAFILIIYCYHHHYAYNDLDSNELPSLTMQKDFRPFTVVSNSTAYDRMVEASNVDHVHVIGTIKQPFSIPMNSQTIGDKYHRPPKIGDKDHLPPKTVKSYRVLSPGGLPWSEFVKYPLEPFHDSHPSDDALDLAQLKSLHLHECNASMVQALAMPGLSEKDYAWCRWALSNDGGRVKVGRSYGSLGGKDREKYENKNCNAVAKGVNPSCDDAWGDDLIRNWRRNPANELCGNEQQFSSRVRCWDSPSQARFCVFEDVILDFSKMRDVARPGRSTGTRKWEKGFLSTHCDRKNDNINYFDFYQPGLDPSRTRCDFVVNETVVAFSHDDIRNLGHSMSDFMNVWAMLWLAGLSIHQREITFLNIDAIRQGHNYHDELFSFASHYTTAFAWIVQAKSFGASRVCFKKIVMQPKPLVLFTWDGWWQPMPCSFVGPSSLFQRWNLHIRNNYGLLDVQRMPTNTNLTLLLVVRKAKGSETSRVIGNPSELYQALGRIEGVAAVVMQDLSTLSFAEQVQLVASSSIIIGMHGAGIASTMHMAVGTRYCCGVIEMFPRGDYSPIFGYGNMARRMGLYYERIDLAIDRGGGGGVVGTHVPTEAVAQLVTVIMHRINTDRSSCIHPRVVEDPHFAALLP